jgi:phage shock protein PspC (stress-responsive transcriptional regulator)
MDKTIKINLGGSLFQIDEDAYRILRDYLQAIDVRFRHVEGGAETIEDIESRIAEIFQSQKGLAGVISKENVEAMISVIGKPEDFDTDLEESEIPPYSYQRKKMYRNPDDTIIGGVCSGMGVYMNTDPVWIRLIFILFALFFGVGFFVYIALWIALPSARTDTQKREMYGSAYAAYRKYTRKVSRSAASDTPVYGSGTYTASGVGNAFNEVFRALGKVFFVILRILLIIIGVAFVASGFIALVSFIMVFFFRYPGYFSTDSFGIDFFYLPDFLYYIVNPAVAPWIMFLTFIVVALPLFAMIYWGVRMVFWFRARDGIFSLIALVIWVMSVAALSIMLFNEGVSFAETARTSSLDIISESPDNLYIMSGSKISDLNYDKEISIPDEDYAVYFSGDNRNLYIRTHLTIDNSNDNSIKIDIRKRSAGRSKTDAMRKAESLLYNYRISGDTIFIDEYFTIPEGSKWAFDNVGINLLVPEGTVMHMDRTTEKMLHSYYYDDRDFNYVVRSDNTWVMTEDGLRRSSGR